MVNRMNKVYPKIIMFMSSVMMIMLCFSYDIFAQAVTQDFFIASGSKDYNILITWDTEEPSVQLISPSGEVIDVFSASEEVFRKVENAAIYTMIDAQAGQWKISCDKFTNQTVDISYSEASEAIWIEQFEILSIEGDKVEVYFSIEEMENPYYDYEIAAILDGDQSVYKVLTSGIGRSLEMTKTVSLSNLNSYAGYQLMLIVTQKDTDLIVTDQAISEPFDYISSDEEEAPSIEKLDIIVDVNNTSVTINTEDNYRTDEFLVRYIIDGEETVDTFTKETLFAFAENTTHITIGLRSLEWGKYSQELLCEIDLLNGITYTYEYEKYAVINVAQMPIIMNGGLDLMATGIINSETLEFNLTSDTINIMLQEGENSITLYVTDKNGITWSMQETIYYDGTAPSFRVFEDYNGIITSDSTIILIGEIEVGAQLTLNDELVEVDEVGGFLVTFELQNGENIVQFVTTDLAGNKTTYTPIITKDSLFHSVDGTGGNWTDYIILLLGCVVGVGILIVGFLCLKKKKNDIVKEETKQ